MPNVLNLVQGSVHPGDLTGQAIWTQVSTHQPAPINFTKPLYVLVPWLSHQYWAIPATHWSACHGATLPAQGADCLIVFDSQQNPWCPMWSGAHS